MSDFIRISELCERLNVSRTWVEKYVKPYCTLYDLREDDIRLFKGYSTSEVCRVLTGSDMMQVYCTHDYFDMAAPGNIIDKDSFSEAWGDLQVLLGDRRSAIEDIKDTHEAVKGSLTASGKVLYDKYLASRNVKMRQPMAVEKDAAVRVGAINELSKRLLGFSDYRIFTMGEMQDIIGGRSREMVYRDSYSADDYIVRIAGKSFFYYNPVKKERIRDSYEIPVQIAKSLI